MLTFAYLFAYFYPSPCLTLSQLSYFCYLNPWTVFWVLVIISSFLKHRGLLSQKYSISLVLPVCFTRALKLWSFQVHILGNHTEQLVVSDIIWVFCHLSSRWKDVISQEMQTSTLLHQDVFVHNKRVHRRKAIVWRVWGGVCVCVWGWMLAEGPVMQLSWSWIPWHPALGSLRWTPITKSCQPENTKKISIGLGFQG